MKPRIRTTPPRIAALAIAAGVAAFALPGAANAAVRPRSPTTTLTLTGDARARTSRSASTGGNITHNFRHRPAGVGSRAPPTSTRPGRRSRRCRPTARSRSSSNAGGGNDNINVSAAELRRHADDQRRRRRRHRSSAPPRVDAIDGGDGNDRITAFRGNETIHGGAGNDVIIWNNGDGNDINEGDAGVDETLIVEGNADDGNAVSQNGAITHFERVSAPAASPSTPTTMEKLTLNSFSGDDTLDDEPRRAAGHEHRLRPGRRHDHDR